jgi:hypothetical protein
MTVPFHVFPQINSPFVDEFRGDDFWEKFHAAEEYRSNCLQAPDKIPTGCCKQSKKGDYATSDFTFR